MTHDECRHCRHEIGRLKIDGYARLIRHCCREDCHAIWIDDGEVPLEEKTHGYPKIATAKAFFLRYENKRLVEERIP